MAVNGDHTVYAEQDDDSLHEIKNCIIYAESSINAFYATDNASIRGPHMLLCDIEHFPYLKVGRNVYWTDPFGVRREFRIAVLPRDFMSLSLSEDTDHVEILLEESTNR